MNVADVHYFEVSRVDRASLRPYETGLGQLPHPLLLMSCGLVVNPVGPRREDEGRRNEDELHVLVHLVPLAGYCCCAAQRWLIQVRTCSVTPSPRTRQTPLSRPRTIVPVMALRTR